MIGGINKMNTMDKKLEQEIKIVELRHKLSKKERQLSEAESKREELNETKTSRYVKDSTAKTLETAQIVGLGIAGGIAGALLGQGADMAEEAFTLGTLLGMVGGTGASIVNHIAYKKKLLSNKVTDIRKYLTDRKIERLQRNIVDLECEKDRVSDPIM